MQVEGHRGVQFVFDICVFQDRFGNYSTYTYQVRYRHKHSCKVMEAYADGARLNTDGTNFNERFPGVPESSIRNVNIRRRQLNTMET